ncbi:MAG: T9SS C-terminal target domain-containing protein [Calditrichaeota bacterium]|nr:MAG: T9SS C-terminal target domain-containing protein [Calditrichota bacterium]
MKRATQIICILMIVVSLYAGELRIVADPGAMRDHFGSAVAMDSSLLIIGAPGTMTDRAGRGQVYLFRREAAQWIQDDVLTGIDTAPFDLFGSAIAYCQDFILVGAQGDSLYNRFTGAAFLFKQVDGRFVQKGLFRSPSLIPRDLYGFSLAISPNYCVIGAPRDGGTAPASGAVYVYKPHSKKPDQWVLDAKLTPADGKSLDAFGCALALSGERLLIGACSSDSPLKSDGAAYIFEKIDNSWRQVIKFQPPDGTLRNMFGASVDIDGDWAVVGAFKDDVLDFDAGSAYVYHRANDMWQQNVKLTAVDADSGDYFGFSVALLGNYLVVGAPGDNGNGIDAGSVYSFLLGDEGWDQKAKKSASDQMFKDKFGAAVAISEKTTAVAAPRKKIDEKIGQGAVYLYDNIDDLALPVTLSEFTATVVNGGVLLRWVTQSEIDNLGFIIQRREASRNWETIADFQTFPELIGRGSSSEPTFYQFTDSSVGAGAFYYRLADVDVQGAVHYYPPIQVTITGVAAPRPALPQSVDLFPAFPNPFNPQTTIEYQLPAARSVSLTVYDMRGRLVRRLVQAEQQPGIYAVVWDGRDDSGMKQSSGLYLFHFKADDFQKTHKVMLVE